MKKAFVLYADQYEPIRTLSDAQSGILFKMLFEYNNTGTTPDAEKTDPMVFMAFMFLKNTLDRDNDKYLKKCEKNKENADKRWNANASDRIPMNANHADRDKNRGRDKDRYINLLSDSPESDQKEKPVYPESFEKFWIAYPKKEGKGAAYKSYQKIKAPRPSLNKILDSIETHSKTEKWKNKQYIPLPATFLNQRRWEDEFTPEDFNQFQPSKFNNNLGQGPEYAEL